MKDLFPFAAAFCLVSLVWVLAAAPAAAARVVLTADPTRVTGHIDEDVYGHFLEHIYHSVNGGLWGELVWSRSFENGPAGNWFVADGAVVQESLADNVRLVFGDPDWTDYEYTVEARKTGGNEGFLILFRVESDDDFYWYNLGGWGNTRHALERGVSGEGRWHTVEPGREGNIETDRWYRVRVRCEGPHLQVWLDNQKLLDFRDTTHPHLRGRVGVGTWVTSAQYRNLRVTTLTGDTLWEGLPTNLSAAETAAGWTTYGNGRFHWSREQPLNGTFCQEVESTGDECGVAQTPFCARKGETYRGSVWVRGSAPDGLLVRFVDEAAKKVLAAARLEPPTATWQEYPFVLTPAESAKEATLRLCLAGAGHVWLDQVSLMADAARKTGGFRSDLLAAIADLKPPIIRWPGGCFAEYYRWTEGLGLQSERVKYPRLLWDDQDPNSFGTDEFVTLCRRVGAEPLLVINIGRHDDPANRRQWIEYAQHWVEYCNGPATSPWGERRAGNGHLKPHHVKYWEIDNETWGMGAEQYAVAVREFVPALKAVDPSIKIAVCGSAGFGAGRNGLEWNRILIDRCADLADYLSIHHYENPDRFADGPRDYERFFRQTAALIEQSANPNLKIFVSEWNAQSTDWRTGLYAGGLLNAFERVDAVAMASPALFLRHVSATAWDNAFINFDHCGWFPAPNYVVMKLYHDHFAPRRVALRGESAPLNVVATATTDGRTMYLKAVNPTAQPVDVQLAVGGGRAVSQATLFLVAPGSLSARNTLADPNAVHVVKGTIHRHGDTLLFTLPRWAVGVVTVNAE